MAKYKKPDPAEQAAREEFRAFFNPHTAEIKQALAEFGIGPRMAGEGAGSYGFRLHLAHMDEHDVRQGYASVDVTITGHDVRDEADDVISVVFWFVRLEGGGPWHLITKNGYLDWLLLGESCPTQGIRPDLHVAIKQIFPLTLEHYDWYERRG